MHRPALLASLAALVGLTLLLPACDANPSERSRPSPLPYGYREPTGRAQKAPPKVEGEELDEVVAVVWGEVLTRRKLVRLVGGRAPGQDETSFQQSLALRRLNWARQQLFVKAAKQEGLGIPSAALDRAMEESKTKAVEVLSKNTGRPATFEEYLAQQNLSEEEFRRSVHDAELQQAYFTKLARGAYRGARPQIDLAVSPAEVRRLYREQPELFDVRPEVTFALYQLRVVDEAVGDLSPAQAEEATRRKAEAIAQALRAGEAPAAIAKRFAIDDRLWREFTEPAQEFRFPKVAAWLFDAKRRPRDAAVFPPEDLADPRRPDDLPGGPVVIGTLTVTPGKKLDFAEAYDHVVAAYQDGRSLRLRELKIIELVQGGAIAWPADLADELVEFSRVQLKRIDEEPKYARARFR